MAELIGLGGRVFTLSESMSSRQDGWVMVQLEDAGLLGAILGGMKELTDEQAGRVLIVNAMRSGKFHHIIAGLLVELDKKWTPASAEQNAEFFAELSDPAEKQQIVDIFVQAIVRFFTSAVPSLTPSGTASSPSALDDKPNLSTPAAPLTEPSAGSGPIPPDGSQTATATA